MSSFERPAPLGSLPSAWLGGTLATALFAVLVHLALIAAMRPGNALAASLHVLPSFLLYAVAAAGIAMALLVAIMGFAETGGTPRSLRAWLLAGLVVSSPLALLGLALANMGDPIEGAPRFDYRTLLAPAFFFACGLVGGTTAFRIRHRSRRQ
ncbi:MAG TPA: hypothetical protein VN029_11375 [Sphingomonas sp.]|nr:hypothetical protein [Sphingomonas sp.]